MMNNMNLILKPSDYLQQEEWRRRHLFVEIVRPFGDSNKTRFLSNFDKKKKNNNNIDSFHKGLTHKPNSNIYFP